MAVQDGYGKSSGSESLVFAYDLKDTVNSYRGEPTTNLVTTIASYYGGNVSTSYANGQYQTSAIIINGVDNTVPSGNFSQVSGTTTDTNSQTYWTIQGNAVVNESNQTVSFSVYLKGNGTCHLATYNDQCCYQVGPDITLTSTWTRYTITKSLTTFVDYHWVAVRGITTSTNVFISSAQWERNSHSTPFTTTSRSNTQGLLDLTGNNTIDLSNVSFDSNAQMTFDGTDDFITAGNNSHLAPGTGNFTYSCWMNPVGYSYYAGLLVVATTGGLWIGKLGSNMVLRAYNVEDYLQHNTLPTVGQWTNVVITRNGTTVTLYYNANSVATATTGYNFVQATAYIGNDGPISSANFNGKITNTFFFNRALTSTEITNNYLKYKRQYGLT